MTPGLYLLAFAVVLVAWHSLLPVHHGKPVSVREPDSEAERR